MSGRGPGSGGPPGSGQTGTSQPASATTPAKVPAVSSKPSIPATKSTVPAKAAVAAVAATAAKSAVKSTVKTVPKAAPSSTSSSVPYPIVIRRSIEDFLNRVLDTPQKRLAAKIALGAAVGALGAVVVIKAYKKIRESTTTTVPTFVNPDLPVTIKYHGEKKSLTNDTKKFRFELPSQLHVSGVPVGNFVMMTVTINGKKETRCYTPISSPDDRGILDFAIKVYPPNSNHPNGGIVSQFIDRLSKDDEVTITGPFGLIQYQANGIFLIKADAKSPAVPKEIRRIGMLAGGSGVTAMVPILRAMLRESGDTPKCSLVYSNLTDQDIIMKSELNSMATKNRKRFKLWYTVDKPTSSSWKYGNGQITDVTIADWMPKPEPGILVVICGPRDMVESCKKFLQAAKYEPDMMYIFAAP